jgi:hypothetical protein
MKVHLIKPIEIEGSLEELQGLVGGYIEVVQVPGCCGPSMILIVDEDGLAKDLPHNPAASNIVNQKIVGPAVLMMKGDLK